MFTPSKLVNFPAVDVFDIKWEYSFNSVSFVFKKFKNNGSFSPDLAPNVLSILRSMLNIVGRRSSNSDSKSFTINDHKGSCGFLYVGSNFPFNPSKTIFGIFTIFFVTFLKMRERFP